MVRGGATHIQSGGDKHCNQKALPLSMVRSSTT